MTGDELKALRKGAGLSQAEMAKAIGMTRETIGAMERGQAPIEKRTDLAAQFVATSIERWRTSAGRMAMDRLDSQSQDARSKDDEQTAKLYADAAETIRAMWSTDDRVIYQFAIEYAKRKAEQFDA